MPDRDVSALHGLLRPFAFAHPEVERLRDLRLRRGRCPAIRAGATCSTS
ncbi:MAG: hypothetical protein R3E53_08795 [Myxococcota bacterium]